MKKTLCLILILSVMLILLGCHYREGGEILEPVEFFYPRKSSSFIYGSSEGVIAPEVREASGHRNDLPYLITMYLRGPQNDNLRSPFPAGCALDEIRTDHDTLYIRLSSEFTDLEGTEMTLACASFAKTCLAITDYKYIHINSQSNDKVFSIQLDTGNLLFADRSAFGTHATEN